MLQRGVQRGRSPLCRGLGNPVWGTGNWGTQFLSFWVGGVGEKRLVNGPVLLSLSVVENHIDKYDSDTNQNHSPTCSYASYHT